MKNVEKMLLDSMNAVRRRNFADASHSESIRKMSVLEGDDNMIQQCKSVILSLPDSRHRDVLLLRYCEGLKFNEIALLMHYTTRWVMQLNKDAIGILSTMEGKQK